MGYTTEFSGRVEVIPPLDKEEIEFLTKFSRTRRMARRKGPYFVDGAGFAGQSHEADVTDYNEPPAGQPSLWCQWIPTEDGAFIQWDGGEKFYGSSDWMKYIIEHFLKPDAIGRGELRFLKPHICNGEIEASGERERRPLEIGRREQSGLGEARHRSLSRLGEPIYGS
jgi:hypothetical protein